MFSQLFANRKSRVRRQSQRRLALQPLESRRLLAIDVISPLPPQPQPAPAEEVAIDQPASDVAPAPGNENAPTEAQQENARGAAEAGQTNRKAAQNDVAITQMMDTTNALFFEAAGGSMGNGVKLNLSNKPLDSYLKVDIKKLAVTNYPVESPVEQIDLNFGKVEFQYQPAGGQSQPNAQSQHGAGTPLDIPEVIVPGFRGLQPLGEPFVFYSPTGTTPGKNPAANSAGLPGHADDPIAEFGNSLLGPGGVVDDNGLDANFSPEIERAIQEVGEELSRIQNQLQAESALKLPYISRLFRNAGNSGSPNAAGVDPSVLMIVPRIIIQSESDD